MAYAIKHEGQSMTASGIDVLAGVWLLISPFVLAFGNYGSARVNDVSLGIVIGVIALFRMFNPAVGAALSWLNALLGIWVIIAPWVLGFASHRTPMINNVVTGAVVLVFAAWSGLATGPSDALEAEREESR